MTKIPIGCSNHGIFHNKHTLWLCQNSYWKWPFIVDFPIENGDFPCFFCMFTRGYAKHDTLPTFNWFHISSVSFTRNRPWHAMGSTHLADCRFCWTLPWHQTYGIPYPYGDSMVIQWDLLGYMMDIPSGKHSHGYWKWPFSSWIYPLKIVILHCYVSLPEGMGYIDISHRWRFIDETFIHKSAFFFS